jgi:hypothetical protein
VSGAEGVYVPLLLGAAVGAGSAAAREGSASNIALSGLAGAGTGGFGGWMAAPTAGATVPASAAGSTFSGVGPLTAYGAAAPATLGTGTAAGALGSNLGATGITGPLLAEYAANVAPAATSSGWGSVGGMRGLVKTGIDAGLQGQQFVGVPKRRPVPPLEPIRAEGFEATPIPVKAIPTVRDVNTISQDILRNYIASLRRA